MKAEFEHKPISKVIGHETMQMDIYEKNWDNSLAQKSEILCCVIMLFKANQYRNQ